MKDDYSITWEFVIRKMEEVYGIKPDSELRLSLGEILRRINYIWERCVYGGTE